MKRFIACCTLALGSLCGSIDAASATDYIDIDEDSYAAIAYSPSSGEFHYAHTVNPTAVSSKSLQWRCEIPLAWHGA